MPYPNPKKTWIAALPQTGKKLLKNKITIEKNRFKWLLFLLAAMVIVISVYYNNVLARQLAEREERLIDLYAKALQSIQNVDTENINDNISSLTTDIITSNNTIPVILTDPDKNVLQSVNLPINPKWSEQKKKEFFSLQLELMAEQHTPLPITYENKVTNYIYYKNSSLISQLQFYPFIQLGVIGVLGLVAYMAFSASRRAEQNQIWVGLAKETAHQLGTPLSSLMAWVEYFRAGGQVSPEIVEELDKDVNRFERITARFSNIGSLPTLRPENPANIIQDTLLYLKKRISSKIILSLTCYGQAENILVNINRPLFEWVFENLCKNSADAIKGAGIIEIRMFLLNDGKLAIDIKDTGKGIARNQIKNIFEPGFTTKKRGWGLGLTLVRRIVEQYHGGKIIVKNAEIDKGTTFRITLLPIKNSYENGV